MIATVVISVLTCLGLLSSILFFPKIKTKRFEFNTFWLVCLLGAGLILLCNGVTLDDVKAGLFENSSINPIKILLYDDKYSSLLQCFELISNKEKTANILLIGRNNKDMDNLYSDRLFIDIKKSDEKIKIIKSLDYPELKIRFLTAHGSKGLEEDYVIIINSDDAKLGFPNKIEDDLLLNLVLSSKDL